MARLRFLIDRLPGEALPRLQPRPSKEHGDVVVMLVSLEDCAPFLETRPADIYELAAVATRLLLLPGGPLVLEDGRTLRLRQLREREPTFGYAGVWVSMDDPGLVCFTSYMVRQDGDVPQCVGPDYHASMLDTVRESLQAAFTDRNALGMPRVRLPGLAPLPRPDSMFAGIPAREVRHGKA